MSKEPPALRVHFDLAACRSEGESMKQQAVMTSDAEAHKRLLQYGPNELAEKQTNPLLKFLSDFWGPIAWMIEGAVVLSGKKRPLDSPGSGPELHSGRD